MAGSDASAPLTLVQGTSGDVFAEAQAAFDSEDTARALELCTTVLERLPGHVKALILKAQIMERLKRPIEELNILRRVVEIAPDDALVWNRIGLRCNELEKFDEGLRAHDRAIELRPNYAGFYINKAALLRVMKLPIHCIQFVDEVVLRRFPGNADAWVVKGNALAALEKEDEAIAAFEKALSLDPKNPSAQSNIALRYVAAGRFKEGWAMHDTRYQRSGVLAAIKKSGLPVGHTLDDLKGKRVVVFDEQGLGDTLNFVQFASALAEHCKTVYFACRGHMHRILAAVPNITLVEPYKPLPPADVAVLSMSVPGILDWRYDRRVMNQPYITAEATLVDEWRARIRPSDFMIGICWQTSRINRAARSRLIEVEEIARLAQVQGVRLISLHREKDLDISPARMAELGIESLGPDFDNRGLGAFVDAAAVSELMDMVISCDTSIAHLAGALGKKTWVAVPCFPDWRWKNQGETSLMYCNMRICQNPDKESWTRLIEQMRGDVERLVLENAAGGTLSETSLVPAGFGEVVDKVTILEIKQAKITDPEKLGNINREHALLVRTLDRLGPLPEGYADLKARLATINQTLWDIEDDIRDCERHQDFGARFVNLARAVYKTNDQRAAVKKQLNQLVGSAIVEEKSYAAY